MEGVEHLFESTMIQRMELTLLETLGWRLNSTTPYSYIELFQWNINTLKLSLLRDFTSSVNDLLLRILLGNLKLELISVIRFIIISERLQLVECSYKKSTT